MAIQRVSTVVRTIHVALNYMKVDTHKGTCDGDLFQGLDRNEHSAHTQGGTRHMDKFPVVITQSDWLWGESDWLIFCIWS